MFTTERSDKLIPPMNGNINHLKLSGSSSPINDYNDKREFIHVESTIPLQRDLSHNSESHNTLSNC